MVQRRERAIILNRILLALPDETCDQLLRQCRRVEWKSGHVIYTNSAPVEYVYFVNGGLVSLIKTMDDDGRSVQVGAVGSEGVVGLFAAYGFDAAVADYVVQAPGAALRINRTTLQNEMQKHDALKNMLARYLFLLAGQLLQVSACNRLHSLEQRCCHWLLVAHDNVRSDKFRFTHDFLALLLGVQRPSISVTANGLQKRGLIRYSHGQITMLDRAAVEQVACECYRTLRSRINHVFGC